MTFNFHQMWMLLEQEVAPDIVASGESPEEGNGALLTSGEESIAFRAIRNGMNLRKEDCGSFWDDFIQVCGDSEGMAELLEVPKEKITGWPTKIKEILGKVEQKDNHEDADGKSELVQTGNTEVPSDQEEHGISNGSPDMRPTP